MIGRRAALGWLAAFVAGCGGARPTGPETPPDAPSLKLDPLVDLVPAAGLVWLVDLRARELLGDPMLIPAVATIFPEAQFDAFARRHGGVDLRQAKEVVVAGFPATTLGLARAPLDPVRVESAFTERALVVEGRAVEHGITRFWGTVGADREQVAVLGRDAVALERGKLGPLQAVEYFAEGRLKRAKPALHADPLAAAAALLTDAPVRAFAPGPFAGEWAAGLAGLLRVTTAAAGSLAPIAHGNDGAVAVRIVLTGAWGQDARAAADRLEASFHVLAEDPLGRLTGIDRPLDGPRVTGQPDALILDVVLDAAMLAHGLKAITDAAVPEIMGY
jgi:hypothetical protein